MGLSFWALCSKLHFSIRKMLVLGEWVVWSGGSARPPPPGPRSAPPPPPPPPAVFHRSFFASVLGMCNNTWFGQMTGPRGSLERDFAASVCLCLCGWGMRERGTRRPSVRERAVLQGGVGGSGRYRSTKCPRHRQFQPLVQRFSQDSSCGPFLVGVLHHRMYTVEVSKYSGGSNLYLR